MPHDNPACKPCLAFEDKLAGSVPTLPANCLSRKHVRRIGLFVADGYHHQDPAACTSRTPSSLPPYTHKTHTHTTLTPHSYTRTAAYTLCLQDVSFASPPRHPRSKTDGRGNGVVVPQPFRTVCPAKPLLFCLFLACAQQSHADATRHCHTPILPRAHILSGWNLAER